MPIKNIYLRVLMLKFLRRTIYAIKEPIFLKVCILRCSYTAFAKHCLVDCN